MSLLVTAAYLFVMLTPGGSAHAGYSAGEIAFNFTDPTISESSGLAQSSTQTGVWFTHNDSGDNRGRGRFFAIGSQGQTLASYQVSPSTNIDWEDMASGPGSHGGRALYFGDFGDNYEFRAVVQIYEVAEPSVGSANAVKVAPSAVHALAFEDGPHNAETLLVDPADGTIVIVTKDSDGDSGVYAATPNITPDAPRVLVRIADLDMRQIASETSNPWLQTTGGDIAPDRSRLVVRTYREAFEWRLGVLPIGAAFDAEPLRIPLPGTELGEAITYSADSNDLFTSSEGRSAPVHHLQRVYG
jgi:hypothetical protein